MTTSSAVNSNATLTWETINTPIYLDPDVGNDMASDIVMENAYESLLGYNSSNTGYTIPWLAQNYTASADGMTYNFTLRPSIQFADGEPVNSTAVYFSYNRLLIMDGSSPISHGSQSGWITQQLLNESLSTNLSGPQNYTAQYVNEVLAENFVQITGPYSFTLHIQHPNAAFQYLIAGYWMNIMAPQFVMSHDIQLWSQSSNNYSLPYPTLSGNYTQQITQYFDDEAATCNAGATPSGCGTTYLDESYQGSLASSGAYYIKSFNPSTNDVVLQANPYYWGGPFESKIHPGFQTIFINYVPSLTTREIDLKNAGEAGRAMMIDVPSTNLFDIADKNSWLDNHTFVSTGPWTIKGPYIGLITDMENFDTNVTNIDTGSLYTFQPFADLRLRLAFADSINLTAINEEVNNNLGQLAPNSVPPGLPPGGGPNTSIVPLYSYNLTAVQDLLLDAMMHPLTSFNFKNGTVAPTGTFNNTFGCPSLNAQGVCSHPVPQTISLVFPTGDSLDENILTQMASVINNVSSTYNMGLTVSTLPIPIGQMYTEAFTGELYMYANYYGDDYPWLVDQLAFFYAPTYEFPEADGWNLTQMSTLYSQVLQANSNNNVSGVITAGNDMIQLGNNELMYMNTYYPEQFFTMTPNVTGFTFNGDSGINPNFLYMYET